MDQIRQRDTVGGADADRITEDPTLPVREPVSRQFAEREVE
ncbi:MAG TPA: hypothetical protein VHD56_18260 [Tepidisphaeraceae bacterium]|nr:hypothetical protein [Tepidisphaeraceae bacterium]